MSASDHINDPSQRFLRPVLGSEEGEIPGLQGTAGDAVMADGGPHMQEKSALQQNAECLLDGIEALLWREGALVEAVNIHAGKAEWSSEQTAQFWEFLDNPSKPFPTALLVAEGNDAQEKEKARLEAMRAFAEDSRKKAFGEHAEFSLGGDGSAQTSILPHKDAFVGALRERFREGDSITRALPKAFAALGQQGGKPAQEAIIEAAGKGHEWLAQLPYHTDGRHEGRQKLLTYIGGEQSMHAPATAMVDGGHAAGADGAVRVNADQLAGNVPADASMHAPATAMAGEGNTTSVQGKKMEKEREPTEEEKAALKLRGDQIAGSTILELANDILHLEKTAIKTVTAYGERLGFSPENTKQLINYMRGGPLPSFVSDGDAHTILLRELRNFAGLSEERLREFVNAVQAYNVRTGAELDTSPEAFINNLRSVLFSEEDIVSRSKTAIIKALDGLGLVNGQEASIGLPALVYPEADINQWLNGVDKIETFVDRFSSNLGQLKRGVEAALAKSKEAIGVGEGGAAEASEGEHTEAGDPWWKQLKFGGIAGAAGIGSLFYLIANGLGGNSIFGKIIGVMAGVFGAVLGYKFFGGGGDSKDTGEARPQRRGDSHNGFNQSQDQGHGQSMQVYEHERAPRVRGRNHVPVTNTYENRDYQGLSGDANHDGSISDEELAAFRASLTSKSFSATDTRHVMPDTGISLDGGVDGVDGIRSPLEVPGARMNIGAIARNAS